MMLPQVILPWPPSALSPNGSQGDWRGKARAAKAYKAQCEALLREKGKAVARLPAGSVVSRVTLIYCPPSGVSRYDFDNMAKRMKQGLDALAEALGVDDGAWRSLLLERGDKCRDGAVIVLIEVAG